MLNNIKSQYILRIIFTYLRKRLNLKLIKYNKNLQVKLNIEIKDFKKYKLLKNVNLKSNLKIQDIDMKILDLRGQKLNDDKLESLNEVEFDKLECIVLNNNKITNLKLLEKYNFEKLYLDNNIITDISPLKLKTFGNLKELYLSNNKISDIKRKIRFKHE